MSEYESINPLQESQVQKDKDEREFEERHTKPEVLPEDSSIETEDHLDEKKEG